MKPNPCDDKNVSLKFNEILLFMEVYYVRGSRTIT